MAPHPREITPPWIDLPTQVCSECEGRRGFYSPGPSGCWEECSHCSGAGTFDDFTPDMGPAMNRQHVELARKVA